MLSVQSTGKIFLQKDIVPITLQIVKRPMVRAENMTHGLDPPAFLSYNMAVFCKLGGS